MDAIAEPLSDQIFHQFLALLRLKRQYASQLADAQGIKPREFSVLRFLHESGPASVGQVQAFLHSSPSTASALAAQLEASGYVTRNRSTEDNRVVLVDLTPSGRVVAEQAPFGGLPLMRRRLRGLPDERLREIGAVLEELTVLMEARETT